MITWQSDKAGAVNQAQIEGKLVLMDFFNPQ
jgi:hypothetical protein